MDSRTQPSPAQSPGSVNRQNLSAAPQVLFLHGLNTFGDDLLHIGPRSYGRMDRELKQELARCGVTIHSVDGVGCGSPEEQADLVCDWLRKKLGSEELTRKRPLVILGNSLGGLVARVVAHRLSAPRSDSDLADLAPWTIPLVVTWGTPHRGTVAAGITRELASRHRQLFQTVRRLATTIRYDLDERDQTFRHYTPQAMDVFNLKYPPLTGVVREVSLLCRVPMRDVAPCFWLLYPRLHGRNYINMLKDYVSQSETHAPSDGFIPVGSQAWGETRGDFRLDHFVQMGFAELLPQKAQREFARSEFRNLVKTLVDLIEETTRRSGI